MPMAITSKEKKFQIIRRRFLVVGHTHFPSDRDFAIIEKYKRHYIKQVYSPDDWYQAVLKAKRKSPFKVIVVQQEDTLSFKDLQLQITMKSQTMIIRRSLTLEQSVHLNSYKIVQM